jgi:DNA-binding GntR family transcriptional regulator
MAKAVDKAYQTVRERIVRGVYPASSRITEQEVAAAAGVSRTPVREALRKLHAEGLLEFIPHQGRRSSRWTSTRATAS